MILSADCFSDANKPESSKQANKTDDKDSAPLKINPSRVMSIKIGADKWEARTKLFSWTSDGSTNLIATADSEEAAREELDKKFSNLASPMIVRCKISS